MRGPARRVPARAALAALAALAAVAAVAGEGGGREGPGKRAVVIGAVNADITVAVGRLPAREETLVAAAPSTSVATGGKGANQAIALARLGAPGAEVEFLGVFAGPRDPHSAMLKASLSRAGVRIDRSFQSGLESGKGFVMLEADGGAATSVVVPGANADWGRASRDDFLRVLRGAALLLLQREVPEIVNALALDAATELGVPVILDAGGEDRPVAREALAAALWFCPNEGELQRLTGFKTGTVVEVVAAARQLQEAGARNVLVTLGERGAVAVTEAGRVLTQPALPADAVDATAAGDASRAAFAAALLEGAPLAAGALVRAVAAGALAVEKRGAVPSLPRRADVAARLAAAGLTPDERLATVADGGGEAGAGLWGALKALWRAAVGVARKVEAHGGSGGGGAAEPVLSSRLNSMRARPDLAAEGEGGPGGAGPSAAQLVRRQGRVRGLGEVHLNFPEHAEGVELAELLTALEAAGLEAGAVNVRFPGEGAGAFTNPDPARRRAAVELAVEACDFARNLGAGHLVVWPRMDGYDYSFQVDYAAAWGRAVQSFREVSDACPDLSVSLEWKPTDERSRFSLVPSTGAAVLLAKEVGRPNMGLTLDLGHAVMAGENFAQSLALAGDLLFGVHLGDGRRGQEDGLAFGSVDPWGALEAVAELRRAAFAGFVYFDTFPLNEDPVREAELNVRRFRRMWRAAAALEAGGELAALRERHDAVGVLELLEKRTVAGGLQL